MKRLLTTIIVLLYTTVLLYAFDIFAENEQPQKTITLQSEISLRVYHDKSLEPGLKFGFSVDYEADAYRTQVALSYDAKKDTVTAKQLSISLFWNRNTLEAGWTTHPWGSASLSHVVDVLNAQDLSNGFLDDLEAMKRRELLISFTTYGKRSSLDVVLKPGFLPTTLMRTGRWSLLPPQFSTVVLSEQETEQLETIGGGARYRIQMGTIDLGLLYFNGYWPQSGFTNLIIDSSTFMVTSAETLYTRYQLMGFESNTLLGPLTLALEGGFFLSEDTKGTDPGRYNSKWAYLAELSYTHGSGMFFAFAYQGQYILDFPTSPLDVDVLASYDNKAYANTLIAAVELQAFRNLLTCRVAGTYQIESTGYLLFASATYALQDNLSIFIKSSWYGSIEDKSSLYQRWDANDSLQIGLKAWF